MNAILEHEQLPLKNYVPSHFYFSPLDPFQKGGPFSHPVQNLQTLLA